MNNRSIHTELQTQSTGTHTLPSLPENIAEGLSHKDSEERQIRQRKRPIPCILLSDGSRPLRSPSISFNPHYKPQSRSPEIFQKGTGQEGEYGLRKIERNILDFALERTLTRLGSREAQSGDWVLSLGFYCCCPGHWQDPVRVLTGLGDPGSNHPL